VQGGPRRADGCAWARTVTAPAPVQIDEASWRRRRPWSSAKPIGRRSSRRIGKFRRPARTRAPPVWVKSGMSMMTSHRDAPPTESAASRMEMRRRMRAAAAPEWRRSQLMQAHRAGNRARKPRAAMALRDAENPTGPGAAASMAPSGASRDDRPTLRRDDEYIKAGARGAGHSCPRLRNRRAHPTTKSRHGSAASRAAAARPQWWLRAITAIPASPPEPTSAERFGPDRRQVKQPRSCWPLEPSQAPADAAAFNPIRPASRSMMDAFQHGVPVLRARIGLPNAPAAGRRPPLADTERVIAPAGRSHDPYRPSTRRQGHAPQHTQWAR